MRNIVGECFLFVLLMLAQDVYAASLLKSQSFPKTFQDLSFTQRINVLSEGYEPWESEYDANGHCISGCIYSGITIKDELNVLQQNTNNARRNLVQYIQNQPQQQNIISQPQLKNLSKSANQTKWLCMLMPMWKQNNFCFFYIQKHNFQTNRNKENRNKNSLSYWFNMTIN